MAKHTLRPKVRILPASSFSTQKWSGGTTTELFIYPENASYTARNFDFRLSMATVEVETSEFTPLPGIQRKTLILDGEIALSHNDEAPMELRKFDVARYDGGWKTHSKGKCTDFNLMTRGNTSGTLEAKTLESGEQWIMPTRTHSCIFVYRGRLALIDAREAEVAETGSLIIGGKALGPMLLLKALEDCELVVVNL